MATGFTPGVTEAKAPAPAPPDAQEPPLAPPPLRGLRTAVTVVDLAAPAKKMPARRKARAPSPAMGSRDRARSRTPPRAARSSSYAGPYPSQPAASRAPPQELAPAPADFTPRQPRTPPPRRLLALRDAPAPSSSVPRAYFDKTVAPPTQVPPVASRAAPLAAWRAGARVRSRSPELLGHCWGRRTSDDSRGLRHIRRPPFLGTAPASTS